MNEHNHPQSKQVINRLSRATGHLESVKKMAEEGRDCSELLVQISAVISALNNASKVILEDHINHCIVEAAKVDDKKVINDLIDAINQYVGITIKKEDGIH
jgi:DNA-binding FrmR family transcriptional regulator